MASDTNPGGLVVFAHGRESGPWGSKISHLAGVARDLGWAVESPDYRFSLDPRPRLAHLLAAKPRAPSGGALVLAGSSLGGWVSAMACEGLRPDGLFLMAPALYFEGFAEEPAGTPALCTVVHGWRDDVVPPERSRRFAERRRAALHLLDSDHGLNDQLPMLGLLFADLLRRATATAVAAAAEEKPQPTAPRPGA